jgi:hypothetical protein
MPLSNAEKQAWHERNLDNGTKTGTQFVFDLSATKQLKRVAAHKGRSVTSLIRAASAERLIVGRLSGKDLKRYYGD